MGHTISHTVRQPHARYDDVGYQAACLRKHTHARAHARTHARISLSPACISTWGMEGQALAQLPRSLAGLKQRILDGGEVRQLLRLVLGHPREDAWVDTSDPGSIFLARVLGTQMSGCCGHPDVRLLCVSWSGCCVLVGHPDVRLMCVSWSGCCVLVGQVVVC